LKQKINLLSSQVKTLKKSFNHEKREQDTFEKKAYKVLQAIYYKQLRIKINLRNR